MKTPTVSNNQVIIVAPKDGRSVKAMSLLGGSEWSEYKAPEGVHILPLLSGAITALAFGGENIREVATFNAVAGSESPWIRQTLRKPAKGELIPSFSANLLYFHVDNAIYAFSGDAHRWDTLVVEGSETSQISILPTAIMVEQGDSIYVFSSTLGRWSKGSNAAGSESIEPKK